MIKRTATSVPRDEGLVVHDGWRDVEVRWVVSADETDSRLGSVAWIEVPPGASYEVHRHPECERIVYVLEGEGFHCGSGDFDLKLDTDDALLVRSGQWHGFFNNTHKPARLISVYAPFAQVSEAQYQSYDGRSDSLSEEENAVVRVSGSETLEDPSLRDDEGFIDLHVRWLVNADQAASEHMLFGLSRFGPQGSHVMHRHPQAEEVCYVVEGKGVQLTADGETPVGPGELTFCKKDEWHGHVAGDGGMRFIFLYMGAPSLSAAEYELYDPEEAKRLAEVARSRKGR